MISVEDAMGTPSDSGSGSSSGPDEPFDPYRFGRPDHPVPPEFAPPGYVPDPEPAPAGPTPYLGPPTRSAPGNYRPPSTPYPYGQPPYGQPPQGQQPYGQPPHGQPPYGAPPLYGYPTAKAGNGKAVAAMVLGIASILLCWLSVLDAAVIIPAIVFGFLGLAQAKKRGGVGKAMAIAGLACAAVATVLAVVVTVLVSNAISECGGTANQNDPGFNQCVQDNFF
ncbi:MAG: hypothetical protein ABI345_05100 [Jatrophihabitans sp.]